MLACQQYASREDVDDEASFNYIVILEEDKLDSIIPTYNEYGTETFTGVSEKGIVDVLGGTNKEKKELIIMLKEFEEWLLNTEERLNNISQATLQVTSPDLLKRVTKEITTYYPMLEEIVTAGNTILGSKQGKEAFALKRQMCMLSDRWDTLYEKSKKKEKDVSKRLESWFGYNEKYTFLTNYLNEVKTNLTFDKCKSSEELTARTSALKAFFEELKGKSTILSELLQEGSHLPSKFQFLSHIEIKQELSDMEKRFRSTIEDISSLIDKQELLIVDLCYMVKHIDDFMVWFHECNSLTMEYSENPYERGLEGLIQLEIELKDLIKQAVEKKPLVESLWQKALLFEIKSNGIFEVPQKFEQICYLRADFPQLEESLLETHDHVIIDIRDWKELDKKLKLMLDYVESKDKESIILHNNPTSGEEIGQQLLELEELQQDLDTHHEEFVDLMMNAMEKVSLSSSRYFIEKINMITAKWHTVTQLTSEKYQLLSLSQHYTKSSQCLSEHLESIESKLDLPVSLQNKVKKENDKARAMIEILQTKVQILNLEYFLCHNDESDGTAKETGYKQFEDHLSGLNEDWNKLLLKAKTSCYENEQVTRKWRDLSKLKRKFLHWVEDKEQVASGDISKESVDGILENVNKYKKLQDRIIARRCDMNSLLSSAEDILDGADNTNFAFDVTERFVNLEQLVNDRHSYCMSLFEKWKRLQERKHKLHGIMKSSFWLSGFKKMKSLEDIEKCSEECQSIVKQLHDLHDEIEDEFREPEDIPHGVHNMKQKILKQACSVEEVKKCLSDAHSELINVGMIREGISKWCEDRKQISDIGESGDKIVIEAEVNSNVNLLEECNCKVEKLFKGRGSMFAPGIMTEQLMDMKNNIEEVGRIFEIPLKEIFVVDDSQYLNDCYSKLDSMNIWEDDTKVTSTAVEAYMNNQISADSIDVWKEQSGDESSYKDYNNNMSGDKYIEDTKMNELSSTNKLDSIPLITVTEHIDENNYFLCEYLENSNTSVHFVDVLIDVGKLLRYCEDAIESSIFKVNKLEKVVGFCDVDENLAEVILQELETFDDQAQSNNDTGPYNVNTNAYNARSLMLVNDFDIIVFQKLLESFQRNLSEFSKHLIYGADMTQTLLILSERGSKIIQDCEKNSGISNVDDDISLPITGSNMSNNYACELLETVKRIKKCLFGLCEKMLCLLDMSTELHLYEYTFEEIELLQKNISYLYNTFNPVHDRLNYKLDSIAEIREEYVCIEKSIADQEVWLKDAIKIFSIEVMSITDENEIFEFMENKSKYQQELSERCEVTKKLYERVGTIGYINEDLLVKINSLNEQQEELCRLSSSQDQRFENDMENEDNYYEKVEEFITWIGNIKEGTEENDDIAIIFAHHNALVKDIEIRANDLTFINSLGNDLIDLTLTEEKRLSFSNQLEEIRLEWNQLLEEMAEKETLLASIYKVRPRSFARMLVAKSQLQVETRSASPPVGTVSTNVSTLEDVSAHSSTFSISQQGATKGDTDDVCSDNLLDLNSEQSNPMDSFGTCSGSLSNPLDSLDILSEIGIKGEEKTLKECKITVAGQGVIKGRDSGKCNLVKLVPKDKPLETGARCASSIENFSNDMIQTSQKNRDDKDVDSECSDVSGIDNIDIKLKIDIQNSIEISSEDERDLEAEAIVFYVEGILLQIGDMLSQNDDNTESVEIHVIEITKNINSLLQLSSDLQQSLIKLELIENIHYAKLIGSLNKRVTGILEFLEPYIDALTDDLGKLTSLVHLYHNYANSLKEYSEDVSALENLFLSELELSDSFVGFKAIFDTAMNKLKGQVEKLQEIISSIKKNVVTFPSKEKSVLKKCLDNAISKTHDLEKIVIEYKQDIDGLFSELSRVEEKLKPIKVWIHKTKCIIHMSDFDMRDGINQECMQYTASIYGLFKYSSSFLDRLPKVERNNLQMRFEMLFKSLKDINVLLVMSPIVGEEGFEQCNSNMAFLSLITLCTANTRYLLDNVSDAAEENENYINIDQFLMEMEFLEESTSEIIGQFGQCLHFFKRSELKDTSCDLINMLEQQVQIKTLFYNLSMQQSNSTLKSLIVTKSLDKDIEFSKEQLQFQQIQDTFQKAKLLLLILYKHQLDIRNLNKDICVLPKLLVDGFTRKDMYADAIRRYQELFTHICNSQTELSTHLSEIENMEFNNVTDLVNQEYRKVKELFDIYLEFLNFSQEIKLEIQLMIDVATRTIEEVKQQLLKINSLSTIVKFELMIPILLTLNNLIKQGKSIRNVNLQLLPAVDKEQIEYIVWKLRTKVHRLFNSVSNVYKWCEFVKLQKVIALNVVPYLFSERNRCQMNFYPYCMSLLNIKIAYIFHTFSHRHKIVDPWKSLQFVVSNLKVYEDVDQDIYIDRSEFYNNIDINDNNLINKIPIFNQDWQCSKHITDSTTIRKMFSYVNMNEEIGPCNQELLLNHKQNIFGKLDLIFGLQNIMAVSAGQYYARDIPIMQCLQYMTGNDMKYDISLLESNLLMPCNSTLDNLDNLDKFWKMDASNIPFIQPHVYVQKPIIIDTHLKHSNLIEDNLCKFTNHDRMKYLDSGKEDTSYKLPTTKTGVEMISKLDISDEQLFCNKSCLDYLDCGWCVDYLQGCINETNNRKNLENISLEKYNLNHLVTQPNQIDFYFNIQDICCRTMKCTQLQQSNRMHFLPPGQLNQKELEKWQNDAYILKNDGQYQTQCELSDKKDNIFKMLFREVGGQTETKLIQNHHAHINISENHFLKTGSLEAIYHLSLIEKAICNFSLFKHLPRKIISLGNHISTLDLLMLGNKATNLSSYFETALCMIANLSRNNMLQVQEPSINKICSIGARSIMQTSSPLHECSTRLLAITQHGEVGNILSSLANHGIILTELLKGKYSTSYNTCSSQFHKLCVTPDLSESTESYGWDENDLTSELPFLLADDYCFTLDDLKCETKSLSSSCDTLSEPDDLEASTDIQTVVINILEDAVLQLNGYEKLEVGYQEFKSIDDAIEIADELNFNEAQSELIKCEVLILSLKDQIPDMELDELLEETSVLQKYFSDTCENLIKWKRKLNNLKSIQYDYEIALYELLRKLTAFRERVIENAKISLNSISKQLNVDKQTLLKLKEEVNNVKLDRLNIEKKLPDPVRDELRMMETEFNDELNAMFCNVYKEEAYAKELMSNKINLSQSISKISNTLRIFQEQFNKIIQSENVDSFQELQKLMQDLVKINDDWEHDKNEIKKLVLMLPHEDIKNIESSNNHIIGIFKYIQDQLRNNPILINYFLDIDKRLVVWSQKFATIGSMQKYDKTMLLQEQRKINGVLLALVDEYSLELSNIFKDLEVTFSLNVTGHTNNEKQERMKLCATGYKNSIKEVQSLINEEISSLSEAQCKLENWFNQEKELERKINSLINDCYQEIYCKSKQMLMEEIYNEYYGLSKQFDEIKMHLPMENLIIVQQAISLLRDMVNQLKEKEDMCDIDVDLAVASTTSMVDDLDFDEHELMCNEFGDYGQFGYVVHEMQLTEKVEYIALKSVRALSACKTNDYFKFLDLLDGKLVKLNLRQHRILSLHLFCIEGVRNCFMLSEQAAVKVWKQILCSDERHGHTLSKIDFSKLLLGSNRNAKKIYVSSHENVNSLQRLINLHPKFNKQIIILSSSSFDETNPLQFEALLRLKTDDCLVIDINSGSGKLIFMNSPVSVKDVYYNKLVNDDVPSRNGELPRDKLFIYQNHGSNTSLHGPKDKDKEIRSDYEIFMERKLMMAHKLDDDVEWRENPTFTEDSEDDDDEAMTGHNGFNLSARKFRENISTIDNHIKNIQNENIDNSVTQLCDEVQLLVEEEMNQICASEVNVMLNKLNILKDLIVCSQTDKDYLQNNIDAAEITLFYLALQIEKPHLNFESLNEEFIEPTSLNMHMKLPAFYGSKDISHIHSLVLDPITELDEEHHNETFPAVLEAPVINEKDIVPIHLQNKTELFSSDIFSEPKGDMELLQEGEDNIEIIEESIVAVQSEDPVVQCEKSADSEMLPCSAVVPFIKEDEIAQFDSESNSDCTDIFVIYQPSQLFQQAFPGYFTELIHEHPDGNERFSFKSVTSIYELNDSDDNYDRDITDSVGSESITIIDDEEEEIGNAPFEGGGNFEIYQDELSFKPDLNSSIELDSAVEEICLGDKTQKSKFEEMQNGHSFDDGAITRGMTGLLKRNESFEEYSSTSEKVAELLGKCDSLEEFSSCDTDELINQLHTTGKYFDYIDTLEEDEIDDIMMQMDISIDTLSSGAENQHYITDVSFSRVDRFEEEGFVLHYNYINSPQNCDLLDNDVGSRDKQYYNTNDFSYTNAESDLQIENDYVLDKDVSSVEKQYEIANESFDDLGIDEGFIKEENEDLSETISSIENEICDSRNNEFPTINEDLDCVDIVEENDIKRISKSDDNQCYLSDEGFESLNIVKSDDNIEKDDLSDNIFSGNNQVKYINTNNETVIEKSGYSPDRIASEDNHFDYEVNPTEDNKKIYKVVPDDDITTTNDIQYHNGEYIHAVNPIVRDNIDVQREFNFDEVTNSVENQNQFGYVTPEDNMQEKDSLNKITCGRDHQYNTNGSFGYVNTNGDDIEEPYDSLHKSYEYVDNIRRAEENYIKGLLDKISSSVSGNDYITDESFDYIYTTEKDRFTWQNGEYKSTDDNVYMKGQKNDSPDNFTKSADTGVNHLHINEDPADMNAYDSEISGIQYHSSEGLDGINTVVEDGMKEQLEDILDKVTGSVDNKYHSTCEQFGHIAPEDDIVLYKNYSFNEINSYGGNDSSGHSEVDSFHDECIDYISTSKQDDFISQENYLLEKVRDFSNSAGRYIQMDDTLDKSSTNTDELSEPLPHNVSWDDVSSGREEEAELLSDSLEEITVDQIKVPVLVLDTSTEDNKMSFSKENSLGDLSSSSTEEIGLLQNDDSLQDISSCDEDKLIAQLQLHAHNEPYIYLNAASEDDIDAFKYIQTLDSNVSHGLKTGGMVRSSSTSSPYISSADEGLESPRALNTYGEKYRTTAKMIHLPLLETIETITVYEDNRDDQEIGEQIITRSLKQEEILEIECKEVILSSMENSPRNIFYNGNEDIAWDDEGISLSEEESRFYIHENIVHKVPVLPESITDEVLHEEFKNNSFIDVASDMSSEDSDHDFSDVYHGYARLLNEIDSSLDTDEFNETNDSLMTNDSHLVAMSSLPNISSIETLINAGCTCSDLGNNKFSQINYTSIKQSLQDPTDEVQPILISAEEWIGAESEHILEIEESTLSSSAENDFEDIVLQMDKIIKSISQRIDYEPSERKDSLCMEGILEDEDISTGETISTLDDVYSDNDYVDSIMEETIDIKSAIKVNNMETDMDMEEFDMLPISDQPSTQLNDPILESAALNIVDSGERGTPPLTTDLESADLDTPSLFSELIVVEDERVKDIAFQEMAEKLHASLGFRDIMVDDAIVQTTEIDFINDNPQCSSPLYIGDASMYNYQPSIKLSNNGNNQTVELHDEAVTNMCFHPEIDGSHLNNLSIVDTDSFCSSNENDLIDLSSFSALNSNTTLPLVTNSPLYGKERDFCISRIHDVSFSHGNVEEEDLGLDAIYHKIQKYMSSMVEISCRLNVNDIQEEFGLHDKLEILALLGSQQAQMDSLNVCEVKAGAKEEITHKLQEKLDIMNQNWYAIQEKAFKMVHPHTTKKYEGLSSFSKNEDKVLRDETSKYNENLEYRSLLTDLLERLPTYEEELGVPLSLYSNSEIQWKVSRLQDACQYIKGKQLPLAYLYQCFDDEEISEDMKETQKSTIERSEMFYKELTTKLQSLSSIRFKMMSFESLKSDLLSWLDRLEEFSIKPLLEKEENDFDCIHNKIMKLAEIEKRLSDKYNSKEKVLNNANTLIASVDNSELKESLRWMTTRWENICFLLKELRAHLDNVSRIWKQFNDLSESLEQWLSTNLTSIKTSLQYSSIDSVKLEIELIKKLQRELDLKLHDKETLKDLRINLSQCVNRKVYHVVNTKMADIENTWLKLKCVLQERVEHLALLIDEVEMVNINDMVLSITKCIKESEEELERYEEAPGRSSQEIEDELKKIQKLATNLNNLHPSLEFLLQISDDYKWNDKVKFQDETASLEDNFDRVVDDIDEKSILLKTLLSKVKMIEDMIEDIVSQLSTVDDSLNDCMELIQLGNLDKTRENVKVSTKTISNLSGTVEYVNKTVKTMAKDYKHHQLDIVEQSEKLLDYYQSTNEKVANVNMKLSGLNSYESISAELDVLQNYITQSEGAIDTVQKVEFTEEKLIQLRKELKDLAVELPDKEERIGNLYNSLLALIAENHVHPMVSTWLQASKTVLKSLRDLTVIFEKKEHQIDVMLTSLSQYDEDYSELSEWLAEKEQQYETLLQQANTSSFKIKLALGNKCKKLKDDMSVFVTFSESMQSLFHNKNRFSSCRYVIKKQEVLNSRYEMLKVQIVLLYERVAKSNKKSAVYEVVLNNIHQWLEKVENQEPKANISLEVAGQSIQATIMEAYRYQYQLEEMLNNPDDSAEKEGNEEVEILMEKLEVLVTDLQYNAKQIEKLQKDVDSFVTRVTETTNIIIVLKRELRKRSNSFSLECFKTQKSLVLAKLDQLKSSSENIINHVCATNDVRVTVNNQLMKVSDLWSQSQVEFDKMESFESNDIDTWKEFDSILKTFVEWLTTMREKIYGMEYKLSGSSIEMLKSYYSGILDLRDEFIDQRIVYEQLIKASNKLIESHQVIADNVRKSVLNTEISWTELELVVMKQLDDTKNTLLQWTSYTTEMKNMTKWLRSFEKEIKPTHHRLNWKDLELMFQKFQSISQQFETKAGVYESIKMHVTNLSRAIIMDDQIILQHQLTSLSQLWHNSKRQLREKIKTLKKLLTWVESFSHNSKVFETWLNGVEQSLHSSDFISDPEKQTQRIKLIYSDDLIKYDNTFGELRSTAVQILTYGSTCTFANDIQDKFICLNKRWKQLCQKLGLAHKNVEETVFMLQLLEEMLKQLTTWLNRVMGRLKEVDLDSCSLEYMEESLTDIQDLIAEFDNQDQDFQSIKEIYHNIQESHNASMYIQDLERLLTFSDTFKTKWTETRNKIHMYKSYLLNRVAIYNEWLNEVTMMNEWIDNLGKKLDGTKSPSGIYSENNKILDDFNVASKSLGRIKKTCEHLAVGSNCVSAKKISQATRAIESRFEEITSDYNYIHKINMNRPVVNYNSEEENNFLEIEKKIESWLTEVEIKLISLRPYTSTEDEECQLKHLQELNSEIKEKSGYIEMLNNLFSRNPNIKTITINGNVEELNERYEQALKESDAWIENLRRPRLLTE